MTQLTIDESQIRETAYLMWLEEGQPEGRDQEHWLKAIDALTPAQPKKRAARKTPAKPRVAKAKTAAAPKAAEAKPKAATPRKPRAKKPATA